MFNNLRIFKLKNDYTSKKGEFEYPTCSYVEEDDWVYFMEPVPTVKSFNVTLSYSKNVIDASGGTKTATAGNGSQKWSRTATPWSAYTYTSGSESTSNGTAYTDSGTDTIAPNYSSTSATGSNLSATTKSQTTLASRTVTWTGSGGKTATGTMYVYQQGNYVSYGGGEWTNSDAYDTLRYCRNYSVSLPYRQYTSGVKKTCSASDLVWSCDGDISGSGWGTSGNFCPNSPYSGYGSGHIEVSIDNKDRKSVV